MTTRRIAITTLHYLIGVLLCFSTITQAKNFTQENIKKANTVIDRTAHAYGDKEKLADLNNLMFKYDIVNINANQSRATQPPWDHSKGVQVNALDFLKKTFFSENINTNAGNSFHTATIIQKQKGKQLDHRRQTVAINSNPSFEQSAGSAVRIASTLLAKQLITFATTARYLGKKSVNKTKTDIISFDMNMGPALTLYINQAGYIVKSERVIGPFLVEYYFEDHREHQGLYYARKAWYTINGDLSQEFYTNTINFDYNVANLTRTPKQYAIIDHPPPPRQKINELAKNVYWVTDGGANNLFIKNGSEIISVGGMQYSNRRLHALRKHIGELPLKQAILTHHHSDHVSGVAGLVAEGGIIYTVREHEKIIRKASNKKKAHLVFVDKKLSLQNTSTPIDIYDIGPTPHTEHYLLVHLPEHGIIFEADHFLIPPTEPMPPTTDNVKSLVSAIKKLKLNIKISYYPQSG